MAGRIKIIIFFMIFFFKQLTKVKVLPTKKKTHTLQLPNITALEVIYVFLCRMLWLNSLFVVYFGA